MRWRDIARDDMHSSLPVCQLKGSCHRRHSASDANFLHFSCTQCQHQPFEFRFFGSRSAANDFLYMDQELAKLEQREKDGEVLDEDEECVCC